MQSNFPCCVRFSPPRAHTPTSTIEMDGHAGEGHMDMDSQASGKRGWMAGFDCDEREERRFNLAHHHQLTYEPILHHEDRLTNRFQVIKGHFSVELRRCYRAPVGFVFLWPFTALAGQWRRQTDSPAQCAVVIGFMGPCGDRRQQFLAAEGTVVPSRRGDRRHCWPSLMPWPMPHVGRPAAAKSRRL